MLLLQTHAHSWLHTPEHTTGRDGRVTTEGATPQEKHQLHLHVRASCEHQPKAASKMRLRLKLQTHEATMCLCRATKERVWH